MTWDIAVVVILLIFMGWAYHKGFILALFGLASYVVSILLASLLYPSISKFLRSNGGLYNKIKESVVQTINIIPESGNQSLRAQSNIISGLEIPDFLKDTLLANNNPEVYLALSVSKLEDYIAGYIANICLNIISMVLVFVLVMILMKIITASLGLISRLPVIGTFDKIIGLLFGFVQGTLVIWLIFVCITFFFTRPEGVDAIREIEQSLIASHFYRSNMLMDAILRII